MRNTLYFLLAALSLMSCTTIVVTGQPRGDQQLVVLNGREVILDRTDDVKTYVALDIKGDEAHVTLQIETEEEDENLEDMNWVMSYEDWSLTLKDNYNNTDLFEPVDPDEWWETQEKILALQTIGNVLSVASDRDNIWRAGANQANAMTEMERKRAYYEAMLKSESVLPDREISKFLVFYDVDPGEYIFEWEGPSGDRVFEFLVEEE